MRQLINQNVNYANHTNSSAPVWNSNSASKISLTSLIKNKTIHIKMRMDETQKDTTNANLSFKRTGKNPPAD